MCTFRTVPVSHRARHSGSQCSLWKLGYPIAAGFSENVREWQPLAATRRTSAAHNSGSQIAGSAIGMNRPGYAPHQSSICQSLYACTSAFEKSASSVANSRAANPGKDGKFIEARIPPAFMSLIRSCTS
jgi:hypothetical protein